MKGILLLYVPTARWSGSQAHLFVAASSAVISGHSSGPSGMASGTAAAVIGAQVRTAVFVKFFNNFKLFFVKMLL